MGIIRNAQLSEIPIYGSSRLGQYQANGKEDLFAIRSGQRLYEFSNHLGNVLVTLNDAGNVLSYSDYYPFGLTMENRSWSGVEGGKEYRYGFNGKENDTDLSSSQLIQDYGFRVYNPVIGKFLSVDPIAQEMPWLSPYNFAENKPVWGIDSDGLKFNPSNNPYRLYRPIPGVSIPIVSFRIRPPKYSTGRGVPEPTFYTGSAYNQSPLQFYYYIQWSLYSDDRKWEIYNDFKKLENISDSQPSSFIEEASRELREKKEFKYLEDKAFAGEELEGWEIERLLDLGSKFGLNADLEQYLKEQNPEKVHGNSLDDPRPTYKYTLVDPNGKKYHGIGTGDRWKTSIREKEKEHGITFTLDGMPKWFNNRRDAAKAEAEAILEDEMNGDPNYNRNNGHRKILE
ncbi:RHS repeat domain-containing protein [Flammeovirga sp. EKP202]|uniref:RHS repeat domain-containing protein n=1 Tax=Flammeovirga sp. EKP202 TaxID=2770592 RepID=UPI00165F2D36|nr:RHS repeat-associated core domain-containing protein [Flammeovirga sp. EKP202]MBD0401480.1 hypothetical protein [Flammeovirga sp. EKP202]